MWKRCSRSSALDRAQALLSAERSSRRDAQGSGQESAAKTQVSVGESFKSRSAPQKTQNLFSALSDLSSLSSVSESGSDAVKVPDAEKNYGRELDSKKDLRPQSSLGGGSRFLKKAPAPTKSSQSPVSRNQMHPESESRYVSSSRRASQTPALTKLAEIESRIHEQAQEQARQETEPALGLTLDLGISSPLPARVTQTSEASVQPSSDQSLRGNRFLRKKAAGAVEDTRTSPTVAPKSVDVRVRARSRAAASTEGLERNSVRLTSGVSLESVEEDMRKLLGDSMDSTDYSFLRPGRPSSMKKPDKGFADHQVHPTPPAEVLPSPPSNTAPPRSPASAPRCSSPFRFTGHARVRFSPSALSPSPSPPRASPSPPESPQRSLSSASGHGEVLSLEELFPVDSGSERPHSEMSSVSSEDFKINVMTLDDLAPARLGFTAETPEEPIQREAKQGSPAPASSDGNQQLQEELLDYQSDFESDSRTEPDDYSANQVSEHLQKTGGEEQVVSEVRGEVLDSDVPHERTEDDYSSAFSGTSQASASQTSDRSRTLKPYSQSTSEDSKSSLSHESRTSSQQSRRRPSARKVLKEAAVQTHPDPLASTWPTGVSTVDPAVGMTYMNLSPVVTHTISAEMVEALSTFNPAVFALNELLKQQLAMTRRFIESSRRLHSSLVRSLEPPNYRYTTLEDTKKFIRKHT
ncbi:uncharacterized protein C19orf44 homolog [Archocentrus centrarchus]|uniref:uncharacterized protein C19orf44 homolog n=1 Tax=Archocentrus centrarchus TaxID=63155 RepID=UPI0011E9FCD0|nr:uncharacterized protein C19orf44 homolog [Archocentrus centrarchus]XP_030584237.1 uncharacterized protein C19orf44 homolog [Archocentrus centrarchus]